MNSGAPFNMARFDVHRNSGAHALETPYLLDVQSELLQGLDTRVVVPLRRRDSFPGLKVPVNLMPIMDIEGVACLLETPKLASVPARLLKEPVVSLAEKRNEIIAALDFLLQGF